MEEEHKKYMAYRNKYLGLLIGGTRALDIKCIVLYIKKNDGNDAIERCRYPELHIEYKGDTWEDVLNDITKAFEKDYRLPDKLKIIKMSVRTGNTKETIEDVETPIKYFKIDKLKIYLSQQS